jgi:hypothetical protein
VKRLYCIYEGLMGLFYYRNRGVNRKVANTPRGLMVEVSRVQEGSDGGHGKSAGTGMATRYLLPSLFGNTSQPSRKGISKRTSSTCLDPGTSA